MSLSPFFRLPPITADMPVGDAKQRILTEIDRDDPYLEAKHCDIYSTQEFAANWQPPNTERAQIARSPILWIILISIIAFGAAKATATDSRTSWMVFFAAYAVPSYLIYWFVPDFHRKLILDHRGIKINQRRFEWTDIIGIYIIVAHGKANNYFLIIVDTQSTLSKFDIGTYMLNEHRIATLIEYYRK